MKSLSSGDSFEGITAFNSQSEHAMPIPFHSTVNSALIIIKSCFYASINCIFHHFHPAHGRRPEARDVDPWWEYGTVEELPGAAGPQPARIVKLGTAGALKAAYADPPGTSASLAAGPAWRTTAFAPDGLCRETTPPARPDSSGQKNRHSCIGASRLRVKSVISARPSSAHKRRTQEREPWTPTRMRHGRRATRKTPLNSLRVSAPLWFGP